MLGGGQGLKVEVMLVLLVCLRWVYTPACLARQMLHPWFSFQLNRAVGTGEKTLRRQEMDL